MKSGIIFPVVKSGQPFPYCPLMDQTICNQHRSGGIYKMMNEAKMPLRSLPDVVVLPQFARRSHPSPDPPRLQAVQREYIIY